MRPRVRINKSGVARIQRDSYSDKDKGLSWFEMVSIVASRDNGLCQKVRFGKKCGKPGRFVHHIKPLSKGGLTILSNLMYVCKDCHEREHPHLQRQTKPAKPISSKREYRG